MQICWIASYPRSGNTWLRLMLSDLLFGPIDASTQLQDRIPDLHRSQELNVGAPGARLMKTHFMWRETHPLRGITAACIYLIRDPRDVLLSAVRYAGMFDEAGKGVSAGAVRDYIARGGIVKWQASGFGTWSQHACSWASATGFPRLTVRYESLRADPEAELVRITQFLGQDKSSEEITGAVERNRLDSLRGMEEAEKREDRCWFPGSAEQLETGSRFFNEGRTGQRLDTIEPGLDAMFDRQFGEEMRRHGYGIESFGAV